MTKKEFLDELRKLLGGMDEEDIKSSLDFYSEMIEDSIEDGMSEEEAVASLGDIGTIAARIRADAAQTNDADENEPPAKKKRKFSTAEIVCLIISSPIWVSVLALAVGMYAILWAVIVSLYAAVISMAAAGITALFGFPFLLTNAPAAFFSLGSGFVVIGLAIFGFFGMNVIAKGVVRLTIKMFKSVKAFFVRED